jgi:hypothetical protein
MRKLLIGCICILLLSACGKEKIELTSPALSDYYPLQVGKYIIYRLDSTVPAPFGTSLITRSYRAKDIIDAEITDGQGRKAYRIFRSITDTNGVAPYRQIATYRATPNGTGWVEYSDNNLTFMKLRFPIRQGMEWKGNSFFIDPLSSSADPKLQFYANWTYQYDSIGASYTLFGKTYDSTVKVMQRDETIPDGPFNGTSYQQRNYSVERYAKGIGLVYKDFLHYIFQPATTFPAKFEDESFGIRLRIIDHN